ncbi:putative endonuclease-reverse transcriptase [Trichonephila clavipes]|nr:putative endonuclease-reverse transcriptase [Trichonephila clavipes]
MKNYKLLLYKSLIRSVLTYASETWPLTLREEEGLVIFERKILRCILGVIQVNGSWRRRSNIELYKIYEQPDIVKFVKLQRLKWDGYLGRMNEDFVAARKSFKKSMGNRHRGRPPVRWIDCAEKKLKILKFKNCKIPLPKVGTPGEDFGRRPGPTQGCRVIEEGLTQLEKISHLSGSLLYSP